MRMKTAETLALIALLVSAFGCQHDKSNDFRYYSEVAEAREVISESEQYMVQIIYRAIDDKGNDRILSAPQVLLQKGQESVVHVGDRPDGLEARILVSETNGKTIGTVHSAVIKNGKSVWEEQKQFNIEKPK